MLACISPKLVSSTHLTGMDCNAMPKGSRTPWKPCPTAPAGSGYLKLTHPHPSDVIYRAIRRPDIPRTFTDDLAAAFSRALETDPRTAARLLRVFPSGQERLESLDQARQRSRGSHCQREQATECRLFDARD